MEGTKSQNQSIEKEQVIDAILITNVNEGIGFDLMKCMLSDPFYVPQLLILAFSRTPTEAENDSVKSIVTSDEGGQICSVKTLVLDTTSDEGIAEAFQSVSSDLEVLNLCLNALINNCGKVADPDDAGGSRGSFLAESRESLNGHFDRAVTSSLMVAKAFLPLLQSAARLRSSRLLGLDRALIVNLCPQLGPVLESRETLKSCHYRAARSALSTVTWLVAQELAELHVLVAAMVPGWSTSRQTPQDADSDEEDTAAKLWATITELADDKAGLIVNYDGVVMPW